MYLFQKNPKKILILFGFFCGAGISQENMGGNLSVDNAIEGALNCMGENPYRELCEGNSIVGTGRSLSQRNEKYL